MFERYTERARRALFFARYEASQFGSRTIDADHLLLGLLRENKGVTGAIFAPAGLTLDGVRAQIEARAPRQQTTPTPTDLPFTADIKRALQHAAEEADGLNDRHVGTEHLLLGLFHRDTTPAGQMLLAHGLRLDTVRADIVRLRQESPTSNVWGPGDDASASADVDAVPPATSLTIQILPSRATGDSDVRTPGRWRVEGSDLRSMLMTVCECPATRLELPAEIDSRRYDFSMTYPAHLLWRTVRLRLMLEWLQVYYRIAVTREQRRQNVYVLTAPNGPGPNLKAASDPGPLAVTSSGGPGGILGSVGVGGDPPSPELLQALRQALHDAGEKLRGPAPGAQEDVLRALNESFQDAVTAHVSVPGASASGTTLEEFGYRLEQKLDRLVVDETHLPGRYEVQLEGDIEDTDKFRDRLRTELGLVLTPAMRDVTLTVVRSLGGRLASGHGDGGAG